MILIENTPNPSSLKFIPAQGFVSEKPLEINNEKEAEVSYLAVDLFKIEGVVKVFLAKDFISVTVDNPHNWEYIKPQVLACIEDYFNKGADIINQEVFNRRYGSDTEDAANDSSSESVESEIKDLLEERIRPAVAMDGGDVEFKGFKDGKVYLKLLGACSGCPSATITLKNGIENMLKYFIPEVVEVVSVED